MSNRANSHGMTTAQIVEASKAFKKAVGEVLDGNLSELARRVGTTPQAVQAWTVSGVIPARRVVQVCDALEGALAEHVLRPDIYRAPV